MGIRHKAYGIRHTAYGVREGIERAVELVPVSVSTGGQKGKRNTAYGKREYSIKRHTAYGIGESIQRAVHTREYRQGC